MKTLNRDPQTGQLRIENVAVADLAAAHGTPLYVYSHTRLLENFAAIQEAFAPVGALVAFSMKCNSNEAVLRTLIGAGAGLDIVSGGELERGLRAGIDPGRVIFAGVGKTEAEIAEALHARIRAFNVESEAEAEAIDAVAQKLGVRAPICIRVNPDVDAATHAYISTGKKENKFGIPFDKVRRLFTTLAGRPGLELAGVHCHIGSQILQTESHVQALERMRELIEALRADGHAPSLLNLGGGFGIAYQEDQSPMDMAKLAGELIPTLRQLGLQVIFEPGRSIAGPAGFLLTRVEYVKPGEVKNFAIVDGAMNDLIRPSLYSAYHRIELDGPAREAEPMVYDIVGPICESGDFLGKERAFPALRPGDLLVVRDAGAYGMAMASNYNSRPRPAEVLVRGAQHDLVRRRETLEDLIGPERVPAYLRMTAGAATR